MYNKSQIMRLELEKVGIVLEEPKPLMFTPTTTKVHAPDREGVREILIARGVRARDLDWLEASCPDVASAQKFSPPKVF